MLHLAFRLVLVGAAILLPAVGLEAAGKIHVLIIDGQNNHDWVQTTQSTRATLLATGRFRVDVTTTPGPNSPPVDWDSWRPRFGDYAAVLSNYSGDPWPQEVRESFVQYIRDGGGFVGVHSANNPFVDWKEYNEIIGLGWRDKDFGRRVMIDDVTGAISYDPPGGVGAGHGHRHPFPITVRAPEHPIMKGLPKQWLHARDELYHAQRGPEVPLQILSTAFSSKESGGSGDHEPATWTTSYERGRVVMTVLGHYWRGQKDLDSLHCVGFQTVFARSMEWAATGAVTLAVPENFPTAEATSLQEPGKQEWTVSISPAYRKGGCCDQARKAGGACKHPCCVKATLAGTVCKRCNG